MNILEVNNLCKKYDKFDLDNVSFSLEKGYIMGFIGSNGAGKTTTLKSILGLVKPNSGIVKIFGKNFIDNELEIKEKIAFMLGESDFYNREKVKTVTNVVKRFYRNWDEDTYQKYLKRFKIDEDKKIKELSQGMRVKYSLALALSHNAELLILDEPTSGLDPVARDNILELFQELIEDGEKSILFSTHITTDLEKCADYITYIDNGKIIESTSKEELIESYKIVNGSKENLEKVKHDLIAYKINSFGFTGLIKTVKLTKYDNLKTSIPTLDDIMIYYAKVGV